MAKLQTYESDDLTVTFDPGVCAHAGECVRGLPDVFDVDRKPWVDPSRASAERVLEVVSRCPTGALQARRRAAGQEPDAAPARGEVTVTLTDNGPLLVAGAVHFVDAHGDTVARGSKFALCRCGATANAPMCDGSHRRVGYVSPKPGRG